MMYDAVLVLFFLPTVSFSLPVLSPENRIQLQNIIVFGDSLSDTGNVYTLTNETYPVPPYWQGRYSNGPNWIDQLNISGVTITNYAYGSATTDNNLVQGLTLGNTIPVPGLLQQVEVYLNSTDVNQIDFTRTLYIVWGGGNDFIFNQDLHPCMIVESLFKSVQTLLNIGAKNILVFNQVPVQYFPFSKPYQSPELFTYLTNEANSYISTFRKATLYDNSQISLEIFDIHSIILDVITKNSTNLTNTVDNCWQSVNVTTVLQLCSNPDEYLFVDLLHFTSRAHGLVANAVRSYLRDSYQVTSTATSISTSTNTTTSISMSTSTATFVSTTTSTTTSISTSTNTATFVSTSTNTTTSISMSTSTATSVSTTTSTTTSISTSTSTTTSISTSTSTATSTLTLNAIYVLIFVFFLELLPFL